jgi:hypothetical protein
MHRYSEQPVRIFQKRNAHVVEMLHAVRARDAMCNNLDTKSLLQPDQRRLLEDINQFSVYCHSSFTELQAEHLRSLLGHPC